MCCYCRSPWKCKTRWWLEQSHLASFKARYPETALVGGTQNRVGKVWLPPRIRIFLTFKWQLQNYVNYLEFFIRFHQSLHSFEEWTQDVFFSFLLSPCFFWFSNRKVKWTILLSENFSNLSREKDICPLQQTEPKPKPSGCSGVVTFTHIVSDLLLQFWGKYKTIKLIFSVQSEQLSQKFRKVILYWWGLQQHWHSFSTNLSFFCSGGQLVYSEDSTTFGNEIVKIAEGGMDVFIKKK